MSVQGEVASWSTMEVADVPAVAASAGGRLGAGPAVKRAKIAAKAPGLWAAPLHAPDATATLV